MKMKTIKAIQLRPGMHILVESMQGTRRMRVGTVEFFPDAIFADVGDETWQWKPDSEVSLDVDTN